MRTGGRSRSTASKSGRQQQILAPMRACIGVTSRGCSARERGTWVSWPARRVPAPGIAWCKRADTCSAACNRMVGNDTRVQGKARQGICQPRCGELCHCEHRRRGSRLPQCLQQPGTRGSWPRRRHRSSQVEASGSNVARPGLAQLQVCALCWLALISDELDGRCCCCCCCVLLRWS